MHKYFTCQVHSNMRGNHVSVLRWVGSMKRPDKKERRHINASAVDAIRSDCMQQSDIKRLYLHNCYQLFHLKEQNADCTHSFKPYHNHYYGLMISSKVRSEKQSDCQTQVTEVENLAVKERRGMPKCPSYILFPLPLYTSPGRNQKRS